MNDADKKIVKDMICYIEDIEKKIQAEKLGTKSKTRAVTDIIKELEKKTKNEN